MPIPLPDGARPQPVLFQPEEVLRGTRITAYRFDLLSPTEELIGPLDGVEGGNVEWTAYTAIKGGGALDVLDRKQEVDWLNVRVHPVALLSSTGLEEPTEVGLGIYLPAAPVEQWTALGRSWRVELLDKLTVLEEIVTDEDGNPVTYVAPIGANVLALVVDLIQSLGETAPAIEPDAKVLTQSMVWDVGTSILTIINDLLQANGYGSIWTDGMGQFRVTPYVPPSARTPVYEALAPFTPGEQSLMSPEWTNDRDIYSIPNRYVAISSGSGDEEAMVAVATNEDPASPFSYQARGRWVTHVQTDVEASSQADLLARAQMGLAQMSSVTSGITISHVYLPDLRLNETVRFTNPAAGLDLLCYVTKTNVEFDPTALCQSEIREAVI